MIPNANSLFLTSSFIVKVKLNYLILSMMSPLANVFADYFIEKITTIREELQEKRGTTNHTQVELLYSGPGFNHFKSVSCDELSDLVPRSTLKSCMLDPIPATVLKNCYDLLLPFITKVVKCSLQNSTLTSDMKRAIVRPSLKKPSLDYQESQTDFQPDISLQALREGSREPIHFPSARK